ncbi:hypothetical protein D3C79_1116650 [compost metagenome]
MVCTGDFLETLGMGAPQVSLPETEVSSESQERLSAFALADPPFNVFELPPV